MRIGFLGFTQDADVIIPPPSEVTYSPANSPRREVTLSGLSELRGYGMQSSYALQLVWKDIPERDLSLLAFIPPQETVTLIDQAGTEWLVVFMEPTRAMLTGVSTRDGQPLYSANLTAYPVVQAPVGDAPPFPFFPKKRTGIVTVPETQTPRDPPAPPSPTPEASPVKARARSGLPPTVEYGEGVRFTFEVFSDEIERGRYYSADTDGYLELKYISPQTYADWYSNLHNNRLVESILKRFPWNLDNAWTIGALLYVSPTLIPGNILQAHTANGVLSVFWNANTLNVSLGIGSVLYYSALTFPAEQYIYLGMQYSYGNFYVGLNGQLTQLTPIASPVFVSDRLELVLGGGPGYCDDLLIANSDNVDLAQVYSWLVQ